MQRHPEAKKEIVLPVPTHIQFLFVSHTEYGPRVTKQHFESVHWKYCRSVACVTHKDLLACVDKPSYGRVFCSFIALTSQQSTESLDKYHWKYRLNSGAYYQLRELWYYEDYIEYTYGQRSFEKIRTAHDLLHPK